MKLEELDRKINKRIAKGMAVLDKVRGEDWIEDINLANLDLADGDSCIVGQLFGGYDEGLETVLRRVGKHRLADQPDAGTRTERDAWASKHGFLIRGSQGSNTLAYRFLTLAWEEAVKERLRAEAVRRQEAEDYDIENPF